jgi:hypothetical protein
MQDAPVSHTDETAQASLPRLTVAAGNYIYKHGEESHNLGPTVNIIILAITPPENFVNHRAWWEKDYNPGEAAGQPDCFSALGKLPDRSIVEPQSERCDSCQWAVAGSGGFGKAQACSSFKIVYAVFLDKIGEIFRFKASITTLKNLGTYRYELKTAGAPIAGVITKLSFDPDPKLTYPKTQYSFAGYLPEKVFRLTTTMATAESTEALLAASAAVPQIEGPPTTAPTSETDDLLGSVAPPAEGPVEDTIAYLRCAGSKEDLQLRIAEKKPGIAKFAPADIERVRQVIKDTVARFSDPLAEVRKAIEICEEVKSLPLLAAQIVQADAVEQLKVAFIQTANVLNGEAYDEAVHGTTKEGLPALKKDGSFKAKKGAGKKPAAEVMNDKELNDLLDDLGLEV